MENFKCMCENLKLSKENLRGLKLLFAVDLQAPVWPVDFLCSYSKFRTSATILSTTFVSDVSKLPLPLFQGSVVPRI